MRLKRHIPVRNSVCVRHMCLPFPARCEVYVLVFLFTVSYVNDTSSLKTGKLWENDCLLPH